MIEIWQECSNFQTKNQRLADQDRTIIKKGCFLYLEIIEIHQKINNQLASNTVPVKVNINKEKHLKRNKPSTSENGNPTQPNSAQVNNPEQTLSQEQKLNQENLMGIMNSEKTTLPSLINIEMGTVKAETNKVNQVLTFISTNNITELNELFYTVANLVCGNIVIPSKCSKKIKTRI